MLGESSGVIELVDDALSSGCVRDGLSLTSGSGGGGAGGGCGRVDGGFVLSNLKRKECLDVEKEEQKDGWKEE